MDTVIEVQIDSELLRRAEEILAEKYNMIMEEASVLFIKEFVRVGGFPFDFDPEWVIATEASMICPLLLSVLCVDASVFANQW